MSCDKKLVIVGGTARNVGKTEFVCRLIAKISKHTEVYALKVSAVFPDEIGFHGSHDDSDLDGGLFEETRYNSPKDSSRMLRAGALRSFFLCCDNRDVEKRYSLFRRVIAEKSVVVCESNHLSEYVKPGLKIMVKSSQGDIKERAAQRLHEADLIILSDGISGFPELDRIDFDEKTGWYIAP